MGFLKRKRNKRTKVDTQNDTATKSKSRWFKPRKTTNVTYTETIAPSTSNVSHYTTISTTGLSIIQNDTMATQDLLDGKTRLYPTSAVKHTPSFDQRIVEAEENIQRQIRMITSRDSDDGNMRLQTPGGVLAFDGLENLEDDDASLAEVMMKERQERMLQNSEIETAFVVAPKYYDPVASGFYSPKQKGGDSGSKSWYDDDGTDLASRTMASSKSYTSHSATSSKEIETLEPSVEVVINQASYLQRL